MAPRADFEFVVLSILFVSHIAPPYPYITCTKRKYKPSTNHAYMREWLGRATSREIAKLPPNAVIWYTNWDIVSGNSNLFVVNGHRFDKIYVVMGEEYNYWIFYDNVNHFRIEGRARLPLTYCSCCLNRQYLNVIDVIKKYLKAKVF